MIKQPKLKGIKKLKAKTLRHFSIFLIASFLFLVITKLSETYTETLEFNVKLKGLADEITIISDSSHTLNTIVKSRGFNLLPYLFSKPNEVIVDVAKEVNENNNTYIWDAIGNTHKIKKLLGESFDVISVNPDTLFFKYEIQTSKIVPVILKSNIEYASGFDIANDLELSNDSIKIIGSKNKIEEIERIETELLSLGNIKTDISETLNLIKPDDSDAILIVPEKITVRGSVKRFTEGVLDIPVTVKNVPKSLKINYFPKTIPVSYYVSLEDYKSITTDDFTIECDYKTIKDEQQSYLVPKVTKKPSVVKSTRLKQNKVEFIIL